MLGAAFSTYPVDIGMIQNTYQIDFLFSLETKGSKRYAYRIERVTICIGFILEENIMKTLIGPLSFLNLKLFLLSLFLKAIFDFWVFLLNFLIFLFCFVLF